MPRKPKVQKKDVTILVENHPITITLHPPTKTRTSWYVYWNGLKSSRSTGQSEYQSAVQIADDMIRRWVKGEEPLRATPSSTALSDEDFKELQRAHFGRKTDTAARERADKTLHDCLEAIDAFSEIMDISPVTKATPDDCAAFQRKALSLPKNWRKKYPNSKETVDPEPQHGAEMVPRFAGSI